MNEFYTVAKIELEDNPQLFETLGIYCHPGELTIYNKAVTLSPFHPHEPSVIFSKPVSSSAQKFNYFFPCSFRNWSSNRLDKIKNYH